MSSELTKEQQESIEEMHRLVTEYIATQAHEWFHVKHSGLRLEWKIEISAKPAQEVSDVTKG